jgi:hypothetical protein
MDRQVQFVKPKPAAGSVDLTPAEAEPKAQIAFVRARSKAPKVVTLISIKRDEATEELLQKQVIRGHYVTYDKPAGKFWVKGAGLAHLYNRKGQQGQAQGSPSPGGDGLQRTSAVELAADDGPPPLRGREAPRGRVATAERRGPAPLAPPRADDDGREPRVVRAPQPLELTRIKFSKELRGLIPIVEKGAPPEPRQFEFFGDVETMHAEVASEIQDLNPDRPPIEYVFMTSRYMLVINEPHAPGTKDPDRNYLNALYNANASTRKKDGKESSIQGDQITYDSVKDLFYVYGLDGRGVSLAQSDGVGLAPTQAGGDSLMFNHKTGEKWLSAPRNFLLLDSAKGTRAFDQKPADPAKVDKKQRKEIRIPQRNDKERRDFSGR